MTDPRTSPPLAGTEAEVLLGFLEWHRHTLRLKTAGLGVEQLRRRHEPSVMTLGGMLAHLAFVEDYWFGHVLLGRDLVEPWRSADWRADPDLDWHLVDSTAPRDLAAMLDDAIARSEQITADALASPDGLDTLAATATRWHPDERHSLRWILVHLVEEYSRHNGHADLLREAIDGSVGE